MNLKGAKLDNALDSVCLRADGLLLDAGGDGVARLAQAARQVGVERRLRVLWLGAAAALLLIELGFMGYFYLAIRHRRPVQSVLQISEARIIRRVDYVTDRFSDDVPWWQLAVWARQVPA